jgi:hypothetical protein
MTTTAAYRAEARNAEKHLRWATAAEFYAAAIEVYPRNADRKFDSLAARDVSLMEAKRAACLRMVQA